MIDQHLTPPKRADHRAAPVPQTSALDLIDRIEVRKLLGGMSRTSSYEDPDVAALAIDMTGEQRKQKRWLRHEIVALVQARIAQRDARAAATRAEALARRERDLARKRLTPQRHTKRGKAKK